MEWKLVSSRLMLVRFRGKQVNIMVFQCYVFINDVDEEDKDVFYE